MDDEDQVCAVRAGYGGGLRRPRSTRSRSTAVWLVVRSTRDDRRAPVLPRRERLRVGSSRVARGKSMRDAQRRYLLRPSPIRNRSRCNACPGVLRARGGLPTQPRQRSRRARELVRGEDVGRASSNQRGLRGAEHLGESVEHLQTGLGLAVHPRVDRGPRYAELIRQLALAHSLRGERPFQIRSNVHAPTIHFK